MLKLIHLHWRRYCSAPHLVEINPERRRGKITDFFKNVFIYFFYFKPVLRKWPVFWYIFRVHRWGKWTKVRTFSNEVWLTVSLTIETAGTCERGSVDEFCMRVWKRATRSLENYIPTGRDPLGRRANSYTSSQMAAAVEYLSIEGCFCKNLLRRVVFTLGLNVSQQHHQLWMSYFFSSAAVSSPLHHLLLLQSRMCFLPV